MEKLYPYYGEHNNQISYLIGADSPLPQAVIKIMYYKYLICIDFSNGMLIGVITPGDIIKAMENIVNLELATAKDIANRNCAHATMDNIEDKLHEIKKYGFLPVVDTYGVFRYIADSSALEWADAQDYEINEWENYFASCVKRKEAKYLPKIRVYNPDVRAKVLQKAVGGIVLEIGAGPFCGFVGTTENTAERIIIEPLANKYAELRKKYNVDWLYEIDDIKFYPLGGDRYISELSNKTDLTICHNALDHTPEWPFVLGNMVKYTKKGGIFYLFTDFKHYKTHTEGHYSMTYNPLKIYKLIENMGMKIIYKNCAMSEHRSAAISVVGVKK